MKEYVYENGTGYWREIEAERLAAIRSEATKAALMERARPLTESEVTRLLIAQQVNTLTVDDNTALRMLSFYPEWAEGTDYALGFKARRGGKLWRVRQAHTSQTGWEPENAPALWEQVCESHSGTREDPIPYSGGMALEEGLYYVQEYVIYRCVRSTVDPVYHTLSELAGLYVEEVTA